MLNKVKPILRQAYYHNRIFYFVYTTASRIKIDLRRRMSDEEFLKRKFKENTGENLDLDNPETFNMKLQWLKIHDRNPLYTRLADKCEVRKYVEKRCAGGGC